MTKYSLKSIALLAMVISMAFSACKEDDDPDASPKLIFKMYFDPDQERLDNFGDPEPVPAGNAGQDPQFNAITAHYVEITEGALVQLGDGEVLYKAAETDAGGATAIDFAQETQVSNGETFLEIPLSEIANGTYEYLRVSLAYQNYDVDLHYDDGSISLDITGTVASFIGYNTYIQSVTPSSQTMTINDDRLQGFWVFETLYSIDSGSAPATTVVNPLAATSPIPAGSCVVTTAFDSPIVIDGTETGDIVVDVKLSTNKSFEWTEINADGKWEPLIGEQIVDMGIRGMKAIVH